MIKIIKDNIKQELKARNKNINDLCKVMKVNRNYISMLKDNTPASKIVRIAHAVGCTPSDLFKGI